MPSRFWPRMLLAEQLDRPGMTNPAVSQIMAEPVTLDKYVVLTAAQFEGE